MAEMTGGAGGTLHPPLGAAPKPGTVTALSVLTLVSGILNILNGIVLTISIVVGTLGVGLLCTPVTVLPVVLGIFEIIYASKLIPTPAKPTRPSRAIAICEICCILVGNVVSVVTGILALVFYGQPDVQAWFAELARYAPDYWPGYYRGP